MRDLTKNLTFIQRAFPKPEDGEVSFDQCPLDFNADELTSFTTRCKSIYGMELSALARSFQKNTARQWHLDCDELSMSMYLGFLGIDEAAPKECGAITLDA